MRDAFGGSFMIRLFLVFLFVYMFFTAIALNYAKAFKVKNKVIDYLQDNEIVDAEHMTAKAFESMQRYFRDEVLASYNYRVDVPSNQCDKSKEQRIVYCQDGIKIVQILPADDQRNKLGTYYRVDTYFGWSIDFFNKLTALSSSGSGGNVSGTWKISGETRPIVKD